MGHVLDFFFCFFISNDEINHRVANRANSLYIVHEDKFDIIGLLSNYRLCVENVVSNQI